MQGMTTTTHDGSSNPAGTVLYIAPERYSASYKPTADLQMKFDVYSFGVILWEIRERRSPSGGGPSGSGEFHPDILRQRTLTGKALPVAKNPCPLGYEDLGERCISYEPERRPSFRQISYSLQDIGTKLNESGYGSVRMASLAVTDAVGDDVDGASLAFDQLSIKDTKGQGKEDDTVLRVQSVTTSSAIGAFPNDDELVPANLMRACAALVGSKWEEMCIFLLSVQDLDEIREKYRSNVTRMFRVLEVWKMKENAPTVNNLLGWFERVDVSRLAIRRHYEEMFSRK